MINKFYKLEKLKTFIKQNNLLFFIKNYNMDKINYLIEKKYIENFNFIKLKIINNLLLYFYNNSIKKIILKLFLQYSCISLIANINFKKIIFKSLLLLLYNKLYFNILCIKLNKKIYNLAVIKKNYSFSYYLNKKLIYKFFIIQLKKISS